MRDDADFAAYLVARWPSLVRALVLLGCPQHEAEDLARAGLAESYGSWDRVTREEDVDVFVYRAVLDRWHRAQQGVDPEGAPVPPHHGGGDAGQELDEAERLRWEVAAELAALPVERREALVLRFVADLTPSQVGDVLGEPVGVVPPRRPEQDYHLASEAIDVLAPQVGDVVGEARRQRRRRFRTTGLAVAALLVIAGAVAWFSTRPEPAPSTPLVVTRATNPVDVAWYAAGRLHLHDVVVELPRLTDLVEVGHAAVYTDSGGRVAVVDDGGHRRYVGEKDPGTRTPLVASVESGWAAWVDVSEGRPQLFVYDLARDRLLAARDVEAGSAAIAIDQDRVYYATPDGDLFWMPPDGSSVFLDRDGLADVSSATRVYQTGSRIDIVQPFFSVSYLRPGVSPQLSPGGTYVLARPPGSRDPGYRPLLYDARSGDSLETGFAEDELTLGAAFGPNHTVSYFVVRAADLRAGSGLEDDADPLVVLRTCDIATAACYDVVPVANAGIDPVFAH